MRLAPQSLSPQPLSPLPPSPFILGVYPDYSANLQMVPVWTMPAGVSLTNVPAAQVPWVDYYKGRLPHHGSTPPGDIRDVLEAVSIVGMAVQSYYHWVLEALGRLLVASDLIRTKEVNWEGEAHIACGHV